MYKHRLISIMSAAALCVLPLLSGCSGQSRQKPRIIITCDPELDDSNSMIRFLLHASDFNIAGLIYTSSQVHWAGDGVKQMYRPGREYTHFNETDLGPQKFWRWKTAEEGPERFINDIIDAYEECYPNLKIHNKNYPEPQYLRSVTVDGNIYFDADYSYDSAGSELIRKAIMDNVPGNLYVAAWGGCSTIARALYVIEQQYKGTAEWDVVYKKVCSKLILLLSGDQDQTYFSYIKANWPDVGQHAPSGGPMLGYGASRSVTERFRFMLEPEWMKTNILDKGPMGAYYRVWGDGRQMTSTDWLDYFGFCSENETAEDLTEKGFDVWTPLMPKGTWISEGDTPTYLDFVDNGLRAWKDDSWGGWSGRRKLGTIGDNGRIFGGGSPTPPDLCETLSGDELDQAINEAAAERQSQQEERRKGMAAQGGLSGFSFMRKTDEVIPDNYIEALQNELSARLSWSISPAYKDANHHPVIKAAEEISAKPGQTIRLKAKISDPDGDGLDAKWYYFKVGSCDGNVNVKNINQFSASVAIPFNAQAGASIHIIVEARDNGTPALTRYHRFVINVS